MVTSRTSSLRVLGSGRFTTVHRTAWHRRPDWTNLRFYANETSQQLSKSAPAAPPQRGLGESSSSSNASSTSSPGSSNPSSSTSATPSTEESQKSLPPGWEDDPNYNISRFSELPAKGFGFNQHMIINEEFKEALRQVLWQFRAPIRYAFAYGSGVFPQNSKSSQSSSKASPHPSPPEAVAKWQSSGPKIIDFIFGVSYTQHWHSLNLQQHRDHYSLLGSLGSGVVSKVQDNFGAGAYFNPYITVNGLTIKYGVVNLDTIYRDLSEWDTLYLAGRLQKPVKILRDDPRIRLANQVNLISALRVALLMLPPDFTEKELYTKITGISYMGDPRMSVGAENPDKVANIVDSQMTNFRQLYRPLIDDLPNVTFNDSRCAQHNWAESAEYNVRLQQDGDPRKRGNMVRRLPRSFRRKLYNAYRGVFEVPEQDFEGIISESHDDDTSSQRESGRFEQNIADSGNLETMVSEVIRKTVMWPTVTQTVKAVFTAGVSRSWKYFKAKRAKGKQKGQVKVADDNEDDGSKEDDKERKS